ncbi:quinoprotein dehydrogenase-associated SoxYZ-like carrier [Neptuniibacter pectenicola]|jgi:sulfur-oxidizing protein SoxY|uniref:quinoprotein dehydrogenase-associated SoxYZ-like carrier n=1 Tax=Neptuniibacter pectenicola TaxID=1806669 RepID=UPI0007961950|nr:quinoprotein dehydrogenase-associated SoxYZ-like carrier [Neptuniibacter pectenicola]KXJ51473.1 MAG: quinoprotein dehydrogenase-associated SoxYZ-like carrier [Neptuniibacter sp. Phe_28]|tara:strand:- start:4306 stop:5055 length:750 start_codon:yes stop_codon:yes gene_type:complete
MKRKLSALVLSAVISFPAYAVPDPLESPLWDYMRQTFIGNEPYVFDDRVKVELPEFAEDPTQVPITVDASALSGDIQRIISWADLNPIQHIFTYYPHPDIIPRISLRIKVQQSTAVRAAVLTKDGVWHVGGRYLEAAGGGCSTPSMANADPYWESHLGEMKSRLFPREEGGRYKFKVIHPMDTGLVDAIPEFYIETISVRSEDGEPLARMELSPPVSENPVITFDVRDASKKHSIWLRDNGGNEFEQGL